MIEKLVLILANQLWKITSFYEKQLTDDFALSANLNSLQPFKNVSKIIKKYLGVFQLLVDVGH